jgi:hypothetical protein
LREVRELRRFNTITDQEPLTIFVKVRMTSGDLQEAERMQELGIR